MPPPQASILNADMPKAANKRPMEAEEDMEIVEEEEMVTEETSLHGVSNPMEGAKHVRMLDQGLENMDPRIKLGEMKDVMKEVIGHFKDIISKVVPQVAMVNITIILRSVKDPTCWS